MINPKTTSEELQHKRILAITQLLEEGRAGINNEGRIVDLRKRPRASKIVVSSLQASRLLMTVSEMHVTR